MDKACSTPKTTTDQYTGVNGTGFSGAVNGLAAAIKAYHAKIVHCLHLLDRSRILPVPAVELEAYRGVVDAAGGILLAAIAEIRSLDVRVTILEESYNELLATVVWGIATERLENDEKTPPAKGLNGPCCQAPGN